MHRQRGITFLGWLFLLIPVALVLYAAIRLTPVYLEYMKIARTLEQVAQEYKGDSPDASSIRTSIQRRFDIESVDMAMGRDNDKVKVMREGSGYTIQALYSQSVPFISNISLQVSFDKKVTIE